MSFSYVPFTLRRRADARTRGADTHVSAVIALVSASFSINTIERKRYWNRTFAYPMCRSVSLSLCPESVKCKCGKTADWIRMPFGVVSGVGRGMDY